MGWNQLRGHADQIEMFRRTISRGRLGQAYLFVGPDGIGKKRFALLLAQGLFCQTNPPALLEPCGECSACKQIAAHTHPDFFLIERMSGKNELLIEQFIGVKERRGKEGLCHELSLRPMSADRKIALVDDADLMNDAAANALLKTLEEPPHGSLVILIAANDEKLLPTIRSRCQTIRFAPLPVSDVAELLIETQLVDSAADSAGIAALCGGSLSTAAQLGDEDFRAKRRELHDALADRNFNSVETAGKVLDCIEEAGTEAAAQRIRAAWFIRFCVEFYRELLAITAGTRSGESLVLIPQALKLSAGIDPDDPESVEMIAALIDRAVTAQLQLNRSMSVGLCIEALFDDLARITRSGVGRSVS